MHKDAAVENTSALWKAPGSDRGNEEQLIFNVGFCEFSLGVRFIATCRQPGGNLWLLSMKDCAGE